jgi:hypothetical protein
MPNPGNRELDEDKRKEPPSSAALPNFRRRQPVSAMLVVETLAAALSGLLPRLHDLAIAIGVLTNLALIAAGLRSLWLALRRPLRLIGPALRLLVLLPRPLLRLRPVFSLLVAHKYPLML